MPEELAHKTDENGNFLFTAGSPAIHLLKRSFVESLNHEGFQLPFHRAVKKIPYIDPNGNQIKPTEPNGIKLETFVFDALPLADNSIIFEIIRSEEFAPIKNASGDDSPEVTLKMMIERALKLSHNVQARAAELLGITKSGLNQKIKKYKLELGPRQ